ncbi:polyprenyl diphosphate synthase [Streptomyces sp. 35G-GA-8]|nr:polyprenyl diphosphate synthase [Streptomyces sp. 35G-GA-8]
MGIVLDGNRRWASAHGLCPSDGHRAGFGRIPDVLGWCEDAGIRYVTLWMLSTENLRRDPAEVRVLMDVITATALHLAWTRRWAIRHLGEADRLPATVSSALHHAEQSTTGLPAGLTANLAVAYGGRTEIASAVRAVLNRWVRDGISASDAADRLTVQDLDVAIRGGQPAPALIIRTSGEQRSSGFLLWTGVEAHHWFTPTYWPAFTRNDLDQALTQYRKARHP